MLKDHKQTLTLDRRAHLAAMKRAKDRAEAALCVRAASLPSVRARVRAQGAAGQDGRGEGEGLRHMEEEGARAK